VAAPIPELAPVISTTFPLNAIAKKIKDNLTVFIFLTVIQHKFMIVP
jgi:hypothetical protein